ncbi:hypothetical protein SBA4_190016 [Candidatus Sulfopaludibacter sp. SbA4]|nr:hypothetical protein SBA4_190016 [Candidatus Sulfopaludibacter sp. SbA4]
MVESELRQGSAGRVYNGYVRPHKNTEQIAVARRRFLARIRNAPDRGTAGKVTWTRDELHERC